MLKQKIKKLEELINKLESPNTELDDAFILHAEGVALLKELENAFEMAKAKIK